MSRTVTGSYTLRPTSIRGYVSSNPFNYYWDTTKNCSNYKNDLGSIGSRLGDESDSTYVSRAVNGTSSNGANKLMNMTVDSDDSIPAYDYTITKVVVTYRTKSSAAWSTSKIANLWFTIWDRGDDDGLNLYPTSAANNGRFCWKFLSSSESANNGGTSIADFTSSKTFSHTMKAGRSPNDFAICMDCYRGNWTHTQYTYFYLYEVSFEVYYSYTYEENVTATIRTDEGTTVSGDVTVAANASATITADEGTTKTLTATPASGYVFDGWYTGGQKVSSDLTYTYTMAAATVYALSKKREIYVGTAQVKAIYIGTTEIGDVYIGTTKVCSDSELLPTATS